MVEPVLLEIPETCCGMRLDATLARLFPVYSRAQLVRWYQEGLISVSGFSGKVSGKVRGRETVTFRMDALLHPAESPRAENIPLSIVFEDPHILVVNKPAGLVVHPGAGNPEHTLLNALLHHDSTLQALPRAGIVHRLDKDTTGLMVVAKTPESQTALVRQMQERAVVREYMALVQGTLLAGGTLDTGFGRHPRNRLKMAVLPQGKQAITHYRVRARYPGCTLLDIRLETGRTHQIRVHMASLQHPVTGDPLYGQPLRTKHPNPAIQTLLRTFPRQALHAATLSFLHPQHDEHLTFHAPLPQDFQSLLSILDEDARSHPA